MFSKKRRMHPYRISFKRERPEDDRGLGKPWELNSVVAKDKIYFFTPLIKGEKAILPGHLMKLWDLPELVRTQGIWQVEEIIHQTEVAIDECDIAILIPALENPVMTLCDKLFETES